MESSDFAKSSMNEECYFDDKNYGFNIEVSAINIFYSISISINAIQFRSMIKFLYEFYSN